jgi:hypothetical protein
MARYRPPRRGIPLGKMTGPVAAIAVLAGLASGHAHKGPAAARSGARRATSTRSPGSGGSWRAPIRASTTSR